MPSGSYETVTAAASPGVVLLRSPLGGLAHCVPLQLPDLRLIHSPAAHISGHLDARGRDEAAGGGHVH